MGKYLKKFATHVEYTAFTQTEDFIKPNVSYCENENEVHYNPWTETRIVGKFNVTDTSSATNIMYSNSTSQFSEIEIDDVVQPSVVDSYTFDTTGEHTVKYTLANPTTIGGSAFEGCTSLTSVTIGNGVTTIGGYAFTYCGVLTSIGPVGSGASLEIPNSVTSIGQSAFRECTGLTSVSIPDSVTSISGDVFSGCIGITSVTIGNSVTSISERAFYNCRVLESITSMATTAPTIATNTFRNVKTGGTLTVPSGSTGYDVWMGTGNYYLGKYSWTKVEQ